MLLTIFHSGGKNRRRRRRRRRRDRDVLQQLVFLYDRGLHKSPVRSWTKGEKTVKTSSSCVFIQYTHSRKEEVKRTRRQRPLERAPDLPTPDPRPDPLCDTDYIDLRHYCIFIIIII